MAISKLAQQRRRELLQRIKSQPSRLEVVLDDADLVQGLTRDAEENPGADSLIPAEVLSDYVRFAELVREAQKHPARLGAAGGDPVVVVPGFLGSSLSDTVGDRGLIWIDPTLVTNGEQLTALQLAKWGTTPERDAHDDVQVGPSGVVPLAYEMLRWRLGFGGYDVSYFPFDWRKNLEESAQRFATQIRSISARSGGRKVRVIAHSQGSLVARRAVQILGKAEADLLVEILVLLGPATFGTFTAAMAISGGHDQIQLFQNWALDAPANVAEIFQSMSGLYQLLPWDRNVAATDGQPPVKESELQQAAFWQTGVDRSRLNDLFGWASQIDTSFFNSKTRIILGEDPKTTAAVRFQDGKLTVAAWGKGDGVVLDERAMLPGVKTYRASGARHAWMAATFNVTGAVLKILGGTEPALGRTALGLDVSRDLVGVIPEEHVQPAKRPRHAAPRAAAAAATAAAAIVPVEPAAADHSPLRRIPPSPSLRRLRVFSLDPMLMSDPETADYGTMEVAIPWEGPGQFAVLPGELRPGPVGEYVEVVDVDPQSGRFYPPIDLNHPHVLAERGLPPSETNPQFHQQMVYAVSMATIRTFERALGRVAHWSPRLVRDEAGQLDKNYVQRLRIYPHAMRQRNAYYDPDKKALLFGYFPSASSVGSRVRPGATVFTCVSFDIVAHETTHALLDGLHRYFNNPSNPDVFAFHEAFADIVALLQRFSNQDLMRRQLRRAKGKLTNQSLIGQMALQFGEAAGGRGGLRQYLGTFENGQWEIVPPRPAELSDQHEPHTRGALLVAAMFQALNSMYEQRSGDLLDVARRDDGTVVFTRELENRLAREAADAARHLLEMSIRALDYAPPVDIGFGDFLRGLITADCDLVDNDKHHYRAAIVNAFAQWGIYPSDQQTLVPDSLRWNPPSENITGSLQEWLSANPIGDWGLGMDRAKIFDESQRLSATLHQWIHEFAPDLAVEFHREFGLNLDRNGHNRSIPRDAAGVPKFEVHSVRPCRRISPDGGTRRDLVIEIVQRRKAFFDDAAQQDLDSGKTDYAAAKHDFYFRGGCTLIVDARSGQIRYLIAKRIDSATRLKAERDYRANIGSSALAANYFKGLGDENPFRLMHSDH